MPTIFVGTFFLIIFAVRINGRKNVKHFNDPHGLIKVAAAVPQLRIGDVGFNIDRIRQMLQNESLGEADVIVFPELSLTGYTAGDLFFQSALLKKAIEGLRFLTEELKDDDRFVAVGLPLEIENRLFNCAAMISGGKIAGIVPKTNIPNYQEFYEKRWFSSANELKSKTIYLDGSEIPVGTDLIFDCKGVKIGVEICEDLWVPSSPSNRLSLNGAVVILNLSATDENIGKYKYIRQLIESQSARCRCVYAYSSAGSGESSTDLVFAGNGIVASNGKIIACTPRFERGYSFAMAQVDVQNLLNDRIKYTSFHCQEEEGKSYRTIEIGTKEPFDFENSASREVDMVVDPRPFVPSSESELSENCKEIINIQSWGLIQRLEAIGNHKLVVGISGGLDSTLALLVAHYAFVKSGWNPKDITAITMPGKATSSRTYRNALSLMDLLGVSKLEIPIMPAVSQHFKDIGHDPEVHDAVYENSQARERTQILMDMANKVEGIVLGTGDLSELALGWCTYNGDHISMYNVNAGVPKTLVKYLVEWFAVETDSSEVKKVLTDIVNTPISPELIPAAEGDSIEQKTEDLVGPYELHDFFLYHFLRHGSEPSKIFRLARKAFEGKYDNKTIKRWLTTFYKRFFTQQFKRSCMTDGPKVGSVCLSPRGDWRMPSDASVRLWVEECGKLPE